MDSVWANVPIDSSLFSPPSVSSGRIGWLERKGTAKLPFRYSTKHIWLKASLDGGPPADFLLDTGASLTAVDSGYAARIGLARQGSLVVQGMGAAGSGSYARVRSLRVMGSGGDGVELADLNVGVIDLAGDLEPDLRKVVGLLGCDFISRFVVEIDYDEHEILLHDPETYVYRGDAAPIPLGLVGGVPGCGSNSTTSAAASSCSTSATGSTPPCTARWCGAAGCWAAAATRCRSRARGSAGRSRPR